MLTKREFKALPKGFGVFLKKRDKQIIHVLGEMLDRYPEMDSYEAIAHQARAFASEYYPIHVCNQSLPTQLSVEEREHHGVGEGNYYKLDNPRFESYVKEHYEFANIYIRRLCGLDEVGEFVEKYK